MAFADGCFKTTGRNSRRVLGMKRLLAFILIWGLLVVTGTLVSANSQTRRHTLTDQLKSAGFTQLIRTNNGG